MIQVYQISQDLRNKLYSRIANSETPVWPEHISEDPKALFYTVTIEYDDKDVESYHLEVWPRDEVADYLEHNTGHPSLFARLI